MQPTNFPQQNVIFAKDQPEYLPLPAFKTHDGEVTSCWCMNWRERLRVLLTGRVFVSSLTFNQALQPLIVSAEPPAPPTHKCAACGSVGTPDPIVGCKRCGFDNMEPVR